MASVKDNLIAADYVPLADRPDFWMAWCVVSPDDRRLMHSNNRIAAQDWRYLHVGHAGAEIQYRDVRTFAAAEVAA